MRAWLVQPGQHLISGPPGDRQLPPRLMAILLTLVENAGQFVGHEELGEKLWLPLLSSEDTLSRCIAELRNALDDNDDEPRFIESHQDRGFRLIAPVTPMLHPPAAGVQQQDTEHLPLRRSVFIGRDREITEVLSLLDEHPLLTITGVGGAGKTRLSLEVASRALEQRFNEICFVDLSPLNDGAYIARSVAAAVELPLIDLADDVITTVINFLKNHRALLILDNCEHLIDACAAFAEEILTHCPGISVLATSREALNVDGEQVYLLAPLNCPSNDLDIESSEAVRLFVTRAREAAADFRLNSNNQAEVAEICRRLDGIPLAIELAAARITHLTPADIVARMDDRFHLLTGGHRNRAQRQRTLQAAVDWSFALLNEREKSLLARLSVFAGGFTLNAMAGICMEGPTQGDEAVDLLGSLVSKSLVVAEPHSQPARYRLLDTIRLYACEKLLEAGEAAVYHKQHRNWFLQWAESFPVDELLHRYDLADMLAGEIDNFRAALDREGSRNDLEKTTRLAIALMGAWSHAGYQEEGRQRLRALALRSQDFPSLRAQCLTLLARINLLGGDSSLIGKKTKLSLELDPGGPLSALALTLRGTYSALSADTYARAKPCYQQAFQRARAMNQLHSAQMARAGEAHLEFLEGNYERAISLTEEVLGEKPSFSHDDLSLRQCLAGAYLLMGRPADTAKQGRLMANCSPPARSYCGRLYLIAGLCFAAIGEAKTGALDESRNDLATATRAYLRRPQALFDINCATGYAALYLANNDPARAYRILRTVMNSYEGKATPFRDAVSYVLYQHHLDAASALLNSEEQAHIEAGSRNSSAEQVLTEALADNVHQP